MLRRYPHRQPALPVVGPENVLKQGNAYWESFEVYIPQSLTLPKTGWIALEAAYRAPLWREAPRGHLDRRRCIPVPDERRPTQRLADRLDHPGREGTVVPLHLALPVFSQRLDPALRQRRAAEAEVRETTVTQLPIDLLDSGDAKGPWGWQEQLYYQLGTYQSASVYFKDFQVATTQAAAE